MHKNAVYCKEHLCITYGEKMDFEKWQKITPERAERNYNGFRLVLTAVSVPRRRIDEENGDYEDDVWKWFLYRNNSLIKQGYENTFDESKKVVEFMAREIINAETQ
jgi:hypothetical protein